MQAGCECLRAGDRLTHVSIPFILIRARRQFGEESFPSIQVFLLWSAGFQYQPEIIASGSFREFRDGLVFFAKREIGHSQITFDPGSARMLLKRGFVMTDRKLQEIP